MSHIPTVPPIVNKVITLVLRSPMHGLISKTVLLITFTGRKSGNAYTTPVGYSQNDNLIRIFTHHAWWKNLCSNPSVTLRLRGSDVQGLAHPIAEDKQIVAEGLTAHLLQVKSDAKYYDVTYDEHGNPRIDEVAKAVQNVVMISVQLC